MHCDDLIIGSGLSALGVAMGALEAGRRAIVICDARGSLSHYPDRSVPASFDGPGGLGSYWHGVIPLSLDYQPPGFSLAAWRQLAMRFYPAAGIADAEGAELYFVPSQPIRPARKLERMARVDARLVLLRDHAVRVTPACGDETGKVLTGRGELLRAPRIWVCAGALGTPRLLAASGLIAPGPRPVCDHIIGYAGRLGQSTETTRMMEAVRSVAGGVIFPHRLSGEGRHFYSLRPARFDFARLDSGIAKRALFGLPAHRVVSGLAGNLSPGLMAEALYNKYGLFRDARHYSVYFQARVRHAWLMGEDGALVINPASDLDYSIASAGRSIPFDEVERSRLSGLYIPGIHLHGSLAEAELGRFGPGGQWPSILIADASALSDIGSEHHSFAMLSAAYYRSLTAASQV